MSEITEIEKYKSQARDLMSELRVGKGHKFDAACVRDPETGTIVCAGKKFISDTLHKELVYIEVGGTPLFAKGDPSDLLKLKKEVGLA